MDDKLFYSKYFCIYWEGAYGGLGQIPPGSSV